MRLQAKRSSCIPDFSDASLTDMCRKLPVTPEEFLTVNGVGENKLKQYGERFISAIAEYKEL